MREKDNEVKSGGGGGQEKDKDMGSGRKTMKEDQEGIRKKIVGVEKTTR